MYSKRLQELRDRYGYTQEYMAELLGVKVQQYNTWETGKHKPREKALLKLSEIFSVSTDYLLGRSDDPQPQQSEDDLSSDELELLLAYRSGKIWDILRLIHQIAPEVTEGVYPPDSTRSKAK